MTTEKSVWGDLKGSTRVHALTCTLMDEWGEFQYPRRNEFSVAIIAISDNVSLITAFDVPKDQ